MNILIVGDINGKAGRRAVKELLPVVKKKYDIEFCVANAENAAFSAPPRKSSAWRGCSLVRLRLSSARKVASASRPNTKNAKFRLSSRIRGTPAVLPVP